MTIIQAFKFEKGVCLGWGFVSKESLENYKAWASADPANRKVVLRDTANFSPIQERSEFLKLSNGVVAVMTDAEKKAVKDAETATSQNRTALQLSGRKKITDKCGLTPEEVNAL